MFSGIGSLVGFWQLLSFEQQSEAGTLYPFGHSPSGMLAYDVAGFMAVQLGRNLLPPAEKAEPELIDISIEPAYKAEIKTGDLGQLEEIYDNYLAYCGTYIVDIKLATVTHHVLGSNRPSLVGKSLIRSLGIDGDLLTLEPPAAEGLAASLVWKRLRS